MTQYRKPGDSLIKQASELWSEGPEEIPYASFNVDLGPGGPPPGPVAVHTEEEP